MPIETPVTLHVRRNQYIVYSRPPIKKGELASLHKITCVAQISLPRWQTTTHSFDKSRLLDLQQYLIYLRSILCTTHKNFWAARLREQAAMKGSSPPHSLKSIHRSGLLSTCTHAWRLSFSRPRPKCSCSFCRSSTFPNAHSPRVQRLITKCMSKASSYFVDKGFFVIALLVFNVLGRGGSFFSGTNVHLVWL